MAEYDFRGGLPRERALLAVAGLLLLADAAPAQAGTTARVSVGPRGEQANGDSFNVGMSANGRFVAFASYATNIVPGRGDASIPQIFVHDRQTGRNEEVSVGPHGVQCEVPCFSPAVSNDGRFVAFFTRSANLVPGGTNGQSHVFVRDRKLGRTELVSVGPNGVEGDGNSELTFTSPQQMTDDGRLVVFSSTAANLIPGDTNGRACSFPPCSDVFVRDRRTARTERVSLGPGGRQARGNSLGGVISAGGRFVAFDSDASNLVKDDTNGEACSSPPCFDVFVRDRRTARTERVSLGPDGAQADGSSYAPSISANGRFVAFSSGATNLVPHDRNGVVDIFVRDRETGGTERISVGPHGVEGDRDSLAPAISASGRFVAFVSFASNLVPGDTDGASCGDPPFCGDVFVRDRETGRTERVSVGRRGRQANGDSTLPRISGDGGLVAFVSGATDLVPGDTNDGRDIFVRER